MNRGKIYDILYSDRNCRDKLDDIEHTLLVTEEEYDNDFSFKENLFFWFILSGIPFLIGVLLGWCLL